MSIDPNLPDYDELADCPDCEGAGKMVPRAEFGQIKFWQCDNPDCGFCHPHESYEPNYETTEQD